MGFFSDIGKKTSETTSKIANGTKLKMKINDNKGKILDIYELIGKKIYEAHKKEMTVNYEDYIGEECLKIDTLSKEIEDAKLEILRLNQKKLCQNCYAEIEDNAQFCSKCGQKQNNEPKVKEEAINKIETAEIVPEKQEEAEIVKQELQESIEQNNNESNNQ